MLDYGANLEISSRAVATTLLAAGKAGQDHTMKLLLSAGARGQPEIYCMDDQIRSGLNGGPGSSSYLPPVLPRHWEIESLSEEDAPRLSLFHDIARASIVAWVSLSLSRKNSHCRIIPNSEPPRTVLSPLSHWVMIVGSCLDLETRHSKSGTAILAKHEFAVVKGHKDSVISIATCATKKLIATDKTFNVWRYE